MKPIFEVKARSRDIFIYGDIGANPWAEQSIEARDFIDALDELQGQEPITVHINSVGGSFSDGAAIYNALRRHPASIVTEVDGYAYSMASYIAMAGDDVRMAENGLMMIHAPWASATGNAEQLREQADILSKHATLLSTGYGRGGKVPEAYVAEWLSGDKDYYFTASEAHAAGLVDRVTDALTVAASGIVSLTDARARFKHTGVSTMSDSEMERVAAKAKQEERDRHKAIEAACAMPSVVSAIPADTLASIRSNAIEQSQSVNDVHMALLKALPKEEPIAGPGAGGGAHGGSHRGDIWMGAMSEEKAREGMALALAVRGHLDNSAEAREGMRGNQFAGMSLPEMARHCLIMRGHSVKGLSRIQIVGKALTARGDLGITHTTSDFPALVENIAEKAVLRGWEEAPETWRLISRPGTLPDFKEASRAALNELPTPPKLNEAGEFRYVTVGDRKNPILLASYGYIIGLTRQLIINDDLGELTRIPTKQGRSVARLIGDLVYTVYTSNQVMGEDGKAIFHADHNNIASQLGAPSVSTLDEARRLMGLQKDTAESDVNGLNIRLSRVIVPLSLETNTRVLQGAQNDPAATRDGVPNPFQGQFITVADARLDAISQTAWYAQADSNQHDTIEIAFLDGNQQPRIESKEGWTVDGMEMRVAMDAGAAPLDYRTAVYNAGQ